MSSPPPVECLLDVAFLLQSLVAQNSFNAESLADSAFMLEQAIQVYPNEAEALSTFTPHMQANLPPLTITGYNSETVEFDLTESFAVIPFDSESIGDGPFNPLTESLNISFQSSFWGCGTSSGQPCTQTTIYYKMIAHDPDCPGGNKLVTWVVIGGPDPTGAGYKGPKCGPNSLVDIAIEAKWEIVNQIE